MRFLWPVEINNRSPFSTNLGQRFSWKLSITRRISEFMGIIRRGNQFCIIVSPGPIKLLLYLQELMLSTVKMSSGNQSYQSSLAYFYNSGHLVRPLICVHEWVWSVCNSPGLLLGLIKVWVYEQIPLNCVLGRFTIVLNNSKLNKVWRSPFVRDSRSVSSPDDLVACWQILRQFLFNWNWRCWCISWPTV